MLPDSSHYRQMVYLILRLSWSQAQQRSAACMFPAGQSLGLRATALGHVIHMKCCTCRHSIVRTVCKHGERPCGATSAVCRGQHCAIVAALHCAALHHWSYSLLRHVRDRHWASHSAAAVPGFATTACACPLCDFLQADWNTCGKTVCKAMGLRAGQGLSLLTRCTL